MTLGPGWARERWRRGGARAAERDVDDELAFHLEMRARLLAEAGMDPQRARDTALERFGDVRDVRTRCITIDTERERRMRRVELWSTVRHHARYTLRRLAAAPGFTLAVLTMLALGIGATTAVFSVVDGVLLRPLPFAHPEQLVAISHTLRVAGINDVQQSDGTFLLYQQNATSLQNVGVYRMRDVNVGTLAGAAAEAERVTAASVSSSLLPTLGVTPMLGRGFTTGEDRVGQPLTIMLSASLWRRKFGGDRGIVGKSLVVDGVSREVVGVLPDDFAFPSPTTGIWLPNQFDPAHAQPASFNYTAVARLKPGMSSETARTELTRILPRIIQEFPSRIPPDLWEKAQVRPVVKPLRDVMVGNVSRVLWILLVAVGLLLVVACANVASLFLVRAEGGQRDLAVRTALGAGRSAMLAQYLGEAGALGLGGGALGVLLAVLGVRALRSLPNGVNLPRLTEVSVDGRVLGFAVVASLLSAIAIGLLPVLRARRIPPATVLKESSRSATVGKDRQRARGALVIAQVALALVLVAGSALMARSFARLRDVRPGFDPAGVLTMRLALPRASYRDATTASQFYDRLQAETRALPGVKDVAITDWLPLTDDHNDSATEIEDHPTPSGEVPPDHVYISASPEYFGTMGVPLLTGRTIPTQDPANPVTEVMVSRSFAEKYWPGGSPIGKRIRPGLTAAWYTIVGVVGDVHLESLEKPAEAAIYMAIVTPSENGPPDVARGVTLVVRTSGSDPARLAPAVRAVVRRLDPALPTYDERPMADVLGAAAARTRFTLLMLGIASFVALAIGAVGLYGVMAYGVSLRRREIGVRIALGAGRGEVSRMIARRGVVLAGAGVVAGLGATLVTSRFLHGLLYEISPTDPVALSATCAVLLGVAALASWLPARRAAEVDPIEALRRD